MIVHQTSVIGGTAFPLQSTLQAVIPRMEEVTQLVQAKVDATVSSLSQSASVSWDRATHGIRQTGHEVFAPLLERGQELWSTAQAHYAATEEVALQRARVGVHYALEHPTTASAAAFTSAVLLLPVTRRALWARTIGRLRSDTAVLDSARRRAETLSHSLEDQQKEIAKLTERAQLAADEYERGRAKLVAAGNQLRRLASSARSLESKAAAVSDDIANVRLRHGGTDAHQGVTSMSRQAASEAASQRASVERHLRKVANLVPV